MSDKGIERQDEQVLDWMLDQIKRAEKRKKQLDQRLMRINEERDAPIGGVGYDPLPRSSGTGDGAASILFKLADIEERIYAQKEEIEKAIVRVMDIIDYLPVSSMEREILELRYIDMMEWADITEAVPMSRSQCNVYRKRAFELLLQNARIRKLVADNTQAYKDYIYRQGEQGAKNQSGGYVPENKSRNFSRKKRKR